MQICKQQDLISVIEKIKGSRALAIDTEFMREKTYHPLLCLVQMATDDIEFLIDPLKVDNLEPLADVLSDPATTKIFHAGRQDLELLFRSTGVVPAPLFDTQVAAPLLGLPQQVGYGTAVEEFCGVKLKKADSLTDWTLRPLTDSQVQYSLEDVRYLIPMYDAMVERLKDCGRLHWLDSEFEHMQDPETYIIHEEDLWRKVKKTSALTRRQLKHVSDIAIWREHIAQKRDIPRRWVIPDELVVEISRREPANVDELYRIRGAREKLTNSMARTLVGLIKSGKESNPDSWPERDKRRHQVSGSDAVADVLMGIVRLRAKESNIAPQVLATHGELMQLAAGKRNDVDVLNGWRYQIVGHELVDFLDGKESVRVSSGNLQVGPMGE
ncbi:MAG: ribonuclease D [Coriobacteriales bacterium]